MQNPLIAWHDQLLRFTLALSRDTVNFPKHVLSLLSSHFGFDQLIIFPYAYSAIDIENRSKREALNNFVALNIPSQSIRAYSDNIHKFDIFAPKQLPSALRGRRVLFTRDIMSPERYQKTDYCRCMAQLHLENQACIYLRLNTELLATICIFRTREDPDFSEDERALMEYLSELISAQYVVSQRLTGDVLTQEGFNMFFRNGKVGAVMLNARLTVLMANDRALECSKVFLEVFRDSQSHFARSSPRRSARFASVQEMVDWIGLDLIHEAGDNVFASLNHEFHFYYWPLIFINVFGDVETRHLILITDRQLSAGDAFSDVYATLTQREVEILRLVAEGYKNEQIAALLHVSIFTVRTHISNIYRKFNVNSRIALLLKVGKGRGGESE